MILTDTTVVIDFLRTGDAKLRHLIVVHGAAICGVTRAEILHGARDPRHRQQLLTALGMFPHVLVPDTVWDSVGDYLAALRAGGLTVPFADAILAALAIANGLELWTRDAHFTRMQRLLPALKLFQEPP